MAGPDSRGNSPDLLAVVLDVSPSTWGHRDLVRAAKDKANAAKGKPSTGPATLDDVVTAVLSFGSAFSCLGRDAAVIVAAASEGEAAVLYPRKGGGGGMSAAVDGASSSSNGEGECSQRIDAGTMAEQVRLGVAELVDRSARRQAEDAENGSGGGGKRAGGAAIAAALSMALCTVNRFMVASNGGVSALSSGGSARRGDDEGVLALMGGKKSGTASGGGSSQDDGHPSARVLVIQASPDRTSDYNALMNCAFASSKSSVVIDGCFVPSGLRDDSKTSPVLRQVVDLTGGVYLAVPSGAAQVGGALGEVLTAAFLPPPRLRDLMNLPESDDVDFRARCFATGRAVDVAWVCNQCLSIFAERPEDDCPTCGASVLVGSGEGHGASKRARR